MRGGYRQNAGRKKGFAAKNAEEARKLLSKRLSQEIGLISNILISKAKNGDIRAIKELFDRAWGRAPQDIQHTLGKQGQITGMQIVFDNAFQHKPQENKNLS